MYFPSNETCGICVLSCGGLGGNVHGVLVPRNLNVQLTRWSSASGSGFRSAFASPTSSLAPWLSNAHARRSRAEFHFFLDKFIPAPDLIAGCSCKGFLLQLKGRTHDDAARGAGTSSPLLERYPSRSRQRRTATPLRR